MKYSTIWVVGLLVLGYWCADACSSNETQSTSCLSQQDLQQRERRGRFLLLALEREARDGIAEECYRDFDRTVISVACAGDLAMLQRLYLLDTANLSRDYAAVPLLLHVVNAEYSARDSADADYRRRLLRVADFLINRACSKRVLHTVAARNCSDEMAQRLVVLGRMTGDDLHVLRSCSLPVRKALLDAECLGQSGCQNLLLLESSNFSHGWDLKDLLARLQPAFDCRDEKENSPVHLAVRYRTYHDVRALLEAGFPVNVRNQVGDTPLMVAVCRGDVTLVDLLLMRGADPMLRNRDGATPLHYAALSARESIVWRLVATNCFAKRQIGGGRKSAEAAARAAGRIALADRLRVEAEQMD